jgi:predicted nucleic acid-binding protein
MDEVRVIVVGRLSRSADVHERSHVAGAPQRAMRPVIASSLTYADSMARYVIDAATLLHLVDNALAVDRSHQLVAPNIIRSEALQLLLGEVRRGERTDRAALEAHERITELKMRLLGDRVSRATAWRIARQQDWEALRDAEYLAVTRLQADALVTIDPGWAAKATNIVPVAHLRVLLTGK